MRDGKQEFYGFYYARALFCIAIVGWHFRLIGNVSIVNHFQGIVWEDIINFHFFLLAVPLFVQLSLYLYIYRRNQKRNYFIKRISYIVQLFIFWVSFAILVQALRGDDVLKYFSSLKQFSMMIYHGGYDLYYFIFVIITTTIVAEIVCRVTKYLPSQNKNAILILLFIITLIPLVLVPFFNWNFRNPINFIPYVFLSILINENKNVINTRIVYFFGILFIILSISDWILLPYYNMFERDGFIMPVYSRISLVFGTIFFILLFLNINTPPPRIIKFLSSYSLGIFCLHRTTPLTIIFLGNKLGFERYLELFIVNPDTINIVPFMFSLLTSIIAVFCFKKIFFVSKYV